MSQLLPTLCATSLLALASNAQPFVSTINFAPFALVAGIEDVAIADMNGDGFNDLVCAYRSNPAVGSAVVTIIYNSAGTPAFAATLGGNVSTSNTIIASGATRIRIRVGNVIGSVFPDVVVYAQNGVPAGPGAIRVLSVLNSPTGLPPFAATTVATPPAAGFDDFTLIDHDFDTDLDVVAVVPGTSVLVPDQIRVFDNTGAAPFAQFPNSPMPLPTVSGPAPMAIETDANTSLDGLSVRDDVIVRGGPLGFETMLVLLGNFLNPYGGGQPFYLDNTNIVPAGGAQGFAMGDFDGNTLADVSVHFAGASGHGFAYGSLPSYGAVGTSLNGGGGQGVVAVGPLTVTPALHAVSGDANGNICLHIYTGGTSFNVGLPNPFCFSAGAAPIRRLAIGVLNGIVTPAPDLAVATGGSALQIWGQ